MIRRADLLYVGLFLVIFLVAVQWIDSRRRAPAIPPVTPTPPRTAAALAVDRCQDRGWPWDAVVVHQADCAGGSASGAERFHFLVTADAEVLPTPAWIAQEPVAHTGDPGVDLRTVAVALEGEPDAAPEPSGPVRSLRQLLGELQGRFLIEESATVPHRALPWAATDCPGGWLPLESQKR